jgi:hypothetical protein
MPGYRLRYFSRLYVDRSRAHRDWIVPDEKAGLARQPIERFQDGAAIHIEERDGLRLDAGLGPGAQHKPVARERSTKVRRRSPATRTPDAVCPEVRTK